MVKELYSRDLQDDSDTVVVASGFDVDDVLTFCRRVSGFPDHTEHDDTTR